METEDVLRGREEVLNCDRKLRQDIRGHVFGVREEDPRRGKGSFPVCPVTPLTCGDLRPKSSPIPTVYEI